MATPEWMKRRKLRGSQFIRAYKEGKPCYDCGGTFPAVCMDFDHPDGAEKKGNVSELRNYTTTAILAEIEKCELVCANCHRIRTENRRLMRV